MVRKATCCCGEAAIEVFGDPTLNAVCHCDNCRRRTGSAFGWSTYFRDEQVRSKAGEISSYHLQLGDQTRWFCQACGTTLYWKSDFWPGQTGVAGGCFVDPLPEPSLTVSNDKRRPWIALPDHWGTSL